MTPEPKTIAVQSVLYGTDPDAVIRAGIALSHAVQFARRKEQIAEWTLLLGDCSPVAVFTDESISPLRSVVEAAGGVISYVEFGQNLGSAAGHNALARLSSSELILILNPDVQVGYDAISALLTALDERVGIVEARQVPLEHPKTYEKYTGDTSWASTACALTPRAAFDEMNGFDSDTFFLYCDDVDYSWRLRLAGFRVLFEPSARVYHDKRLTTTADWPPSPAEIYYSAEAALLLAHKFSRPERVATLLSAFRAEPNELLRRAVIEFDRRTAAGSLVVPIDPDHKVAQFVNDSYAVHRF